MTNQLPANIGNDVQRKFFDFCETRNFNKFLLICDQNTYQALGKTLEESIQKRGWDVRTVCLSGGEIIANEHYLIQVLKETDRENRIFLAVGSGTLTDITRFISFKTKTSFISFPTAASVDGFTSVGAPLVVGGIKKTYICHPPLAVFADLPTLCKAPRLLSAAGFGDLIGKLLSSADWKLGHILFDEKYDPQIDKALRASAEKVIHSASAVSQGLEAGILPLMNGLIDSGLCMLNFGNSNPASGAEHHISHYWELQLLLEKKPAIFHGIKVGVASTYTSMWYDRICNISQDEVRGLLLDASFGTPEEQMGQIKKAYGPISEEIIQLQQPFIDMTSQEIDALKSRIFDRWPEVRNIAAQVPKPKQIREWLQDAGAPTSGDALGFTDEIIQNGLDYGHYFRQRFTINKLRVFLGLETV